MSDALLSDPHLAAEMLVHLGRAARGDGAEAGLTAAQWTALRFFARANRLSRTPSAFAAFHATTRGTASQTVKALVAAGYLERLRDERDGRAARIEVTAAGRALLAKDPLHVIAEAIGRLPPAQQRALTTALQNIVGETARLREGPCFGVCAECRHLAALKAASAGGYHCEEADIALSATELEQLCVAFAPKPPGGPPA